MKVYELLNASESIMTIFDKANVNVSDSRYIPMYTDFSRLKSEGHKITYAVAYLSEKYSLSEKTIYNVVEKFEKEI